MGDYEETGALEPHLLDRQLHACPTCGSTRLVPVRDGADVNFHCEDCGLYWHVELGSVWRVDPPAAAGASTPTAAPSGAHRAPRPRIRNGKREERHERI